MPAAHMDDAFAWPGLVPPGLLAPCGGARAQEALPVLWYHPCRSDTAWLPQPCRWYASANNPSTHARAALLRQLVARGLFQDARLGLRGRGIHAVLTAGRGRGRGPGGWVCADGEGVLAADAVAEAGDVGAVDVHGDSHGVAGVADAVDVAGRREAAHGPGRVHVAGGEPERTAAVGQREDLLVFASLEHARDAPGHVIMDHRLLTGHPDHGRHREAAVGF